MVGVGERRRGVERGDNFLLCNLIINYKRNFTTYVSKYFQKNNVTLYIYNILPYFDA